MIKRSPKSNELYAILLERGYPREVCELITENLNTDFTAQRMISYLRYFFQPRLEDLADEMISILNDRELIAEKHEYFRTNAQWNSFLNDGLESDDII